VVSGSAMDLNSAHAFRYVLDVVPVACWIHAHGVILYANPAFARLLDAPGPERLAGLRAAALMPDERRAEFENRAARLLSGETVAPCKQELKCFKRGPVAVDVTSTVVEFEGSRSILSFFQDITDERRAEDALRRSEIRYRRLVEGRIVGVLEFTAGGIEEANDVFLRLIGRHRTELPSGHLAWRAISPAADEPLVRQKLQELLDAGECAPFEKEFVRPDGSRVLTLMGVSLLEREPRWRALALVIDVSDRQMLEAIQQERARLESLAVLAGGMAHNLNNILTGVIGNASLLLEQRLVSPDSRGGVMIREIIRSGERAAALTAQLLAYAGQGRFMVGPTGLREIIETEVEAIRAGLPHNIRLYTQVASDLPVMMADERQVRRMITSLVDNAVEAIDGRQGGVIKVAARLEQLARNAVWARAGEPLPPGSYCVVEVSDNGPGMDSNTLAHAFDPFFTTKFPGRGLGLAAVAGIVKAARGAVRVDSSPTSGCILQVYLPVENPQCPPNSV
jgi:two-component system CheB/CheR fusion protein